MAPCRTLGAGLASIANGSVGDGALSLRQLALETARHGLQRFFIIDACRAPLQRHAAGKRDTKPSFGAKGQASYRQPVLRFGRSRDVVSPLTVVNACADKQRAAELNKPRRGIFSMAAEEVACERVQQGMPFTLDKAFVQAVGARMRKLAQQFHT